MFRCPEDEHKTRAYTYLINDFLTPKPSGAPDLDFSQLVRLDRQHEVVLFTEAAAGYSNTDHFHFSEYRGMGLPPTEFENQVAVKRHDGAANYLFADGHAETLTWEKVRARLNDKSDRFVDPTLEPETEPTTESEQ